MLAYMYLHMYVNSLSLDEGVVNVTKVNAEDEQRLLSNYPQTDVWYRKAKEACKVTYICRISCYSKTIVLRFPIFSLFFAKNEQL